MQIRVHVKNRMEVSDSSRCQESYTQVVVISFWLWIKSLVFGLDLTVSAWSFPYDAATDEDKVVQNPAASEKDSSVHKRKSRRTKSKLTRADKSVSEEELFGIQWDDYTVVYPTSMDGVGVDIKALRTHSTYTPIQTRKEDTSSLKREVHSEKKSELNTPVLEAGSTSESEYPIDFKNPPHSSRWKARNLPPRKPYIPA